MCGASLCYCVSLGLFLTLVSGVKLAISFYLVNGPITSIIYAKQFLEIKLFTLDYHEKKNSEND